MKKITSLLVVFGLIFSTVTVNAEEENINVEVGEKILTKDVDYTLTYYDNVISIFYLAIFENNCYNIGVLVYIRSKYEYFN